MDTCHHESYSINKKLIIILFLINTVSISAMAQTTVNKIEIAWETKVPSSGDCAIIVGRYDLACAVQTKGVILSNIIGPGWHARYVLMRVQKDSKGNFEIPGSKCFVETGRKSCVFNEIKPRVFIKMAWTMYDAADPEDFTCACSTGKDCASNDGKLDHVRVDVPKNATTLNDWIGIGCIVKPCIEVNQTYTELIDGGSSMPDVCKPGIVKE
jgi:hypothetical protein